MNSPSAARAAATSSLANNLVEQVDALVRAARDESKPLEVEPYRSRLFELFVTADAAGFLANSGDVDLTADQLCRRLAESWGLDAAARQSFEAQSRLPPDQLHQMRILWSLLRMWMEWTYAWNRWREFHLEPADASGS